MLEISIDIFKEYASLMKYIPEKPDAHLKISIDSGAGVTKETQEQLRTILDEIR